MQKRFVYGPGIDEPLVEYAGSGTSSRSWLHADERGSVIAQSDGSGAVTQVNKYDEYGRQQSTNAGRFQYTGQMWLPEAGVYHYRNRQYQPGLGRFLQTDPIGYAGGPNLYAYVLNDPVNLVDPLGMECVAQGAKSCPVSDPDITVIASRIGGGGFFGYGGFTELIERGADQINQVVQEIIRPSVRCTDERVTVGYGPSVTAFLLEYGISVSANVNIAIPTDVMRTGSLRGIQIFGSVGGTFLKGGGLYGGAGKSVSVGYSNGPIRSGVELSKTLQGAAAWGAGGELVRSSGSTVGSAGGRFGGGAYLAQGRQAVIVASTPQLGCYE